MVPMQWESGKDNWLSIDMIQQTKNNNNNSNN